MVPPESPVIDADNDQRLGRHRRSSTDHPQQSVVADRQHESFGQACRWPSAKSQPQMMDDVFEPRCSARPERNDSLSKPFREDPSATMRRLTSESSSNQS
jgi:hypothetical protein